MKTKNGKEAEVKELETEIKELESNLEDVKDEIESMGNLGNEYEEQYIEVLNEGEEVRIGNFTYDPAYVLKNVDPTAYRCGYLDYVDGELAEKEEEKESIETEIEEKKEELKELQIK